MDKETPAGLKQIEIDVHVNGAIEANRNHFGETENDILRRMLLGERDTPKPAPIKLQPAKRRNERVTGDFSFTLFGRTVAANSLKDGYRRIVLELVKNDDGLAERLAHERTPARRLIARHPEGLYLKTPHLAKDFAERLCDGWWIDLNLSSRQVRSRLAKICRVANIRMGHELRFPFLEDSPRHPSP